MPVVCGGQSGESGCFLRMRIHARTRELRRACMKRIGIGLRCFPIRHDKWCGAGAAYMMLSFRWHGSIRRRLVNIRIAACGGEWTVIFGRRNAYIRVGGHPRRARSLIEDMDLARQYETGSENRFAFDIAPDRCQTRMYRSFGETCAGVEKKSCAAVSACVDSEERGSCFGHRVAVWAADVRDFVLPYLVLCAASQLGSWIVVGEARCVAYATLRGPIFP